MTATPPLDLEGFRSWDAPAYLIAEAGVNHGGDVEAAIRMVEAAAAAGLDAVKFQTYKAERIASRLSPAYWDRSLEPTASQFELFSKYDRLEPDDYRRLAKTCAECGVAFLSTPFDVECVEWLAPLVPAFKIASADITNAPLLAAVARTGRPALLSTGASTLGEIEQAVACLLGSGCPAVALLQCTLSYPTAASDAAVGGLVQLHQAFPDCALGYSDHTLPADSSAAIAAAFVLGARLIEKHFTLDKSLPGNDHYHAFDPDDFVRLRSELRRLAELLGRPRKEVLPSEAPARVQARRSVVVRCAVEKGAVLTASILDVKRPGTGIEPRFAEQLVGWQATRDIAADTPLEWHMVAPPDGRG